MDQPIIRPPLAHDLDVWRELWSQYLVFYEATLAEDHADRLWRRILDPNDPVRALLAATDGDVVGFVHFLPHPDTWSEKPICYLQDLYVERSRRGQGLGAMLIDAVSAFAAEHGWSAVYWQTADDNDRARRLYDSLTGGPTGFIVYELEPDE